MQAELFPLSLEEHKERSEQLAAKVLDYKRLTQEKKDEMGRYTKDLKGLRLEIEALAAIVHAGEEWRDGTPPWETDDEER